MPTLEEYKQVIDPILTALTDEEVNSPLNNEKEVLKLNLQVAVAVCQRGIDESNNNPITAFEVAAM